MIIAVAGKGGVGKSTISALIIKYLLARKRTPLLAVDADPNNTLAEKLGMRADCTIGDLREKTLQDKYDAPAGTPKQRALEYQVQEAVTEGSGVDLLVMGRGEGPGCYCSVNNMLRSYLQEVTTGYRHVMVDNEAGLEHLSRRTNARVDLMLVVCDATPTGMMTARRIADLARELKVVEGCMGVVINRAPAPCSPEQALEATGLELLACIPTDPAVQEYEMTGRSLLALPAESPAALAVSTLLDRQSGI